MEIIRPASASGSNWMSVGAGTIIDAINKSTLEPSVPDTSSYVWNNTDNSTLTVSFDEASGNCTEVVLWIYSLFNNPSNDSEVTLNTPDGDYVATVFNDFNFQGTDTWSVYPNLLSQNSVRIRLLDYNNYFGTSKTQFTHEEVSSWQAKIVGGAAGQILVYAIYLETNATIADDYTNAINALDPKLYYKLEETSGTIVLDETGNFNGTNYNCILGGPALIFDTGDKSYNFNGINSYIDIPIGAVQNLTECTICFWAIWNGPDGSPNQRFFDFGDGNTGSNTGKYGYITPSHHTNGLITFRITNAGSNNEQEFNLVSLAPCPINQKVFIAITTDGVQRKLYVNGELNATVDREIDFADLNITKAFIGKSQWTIDPYFNGTIDEFVIFDTILSTQDILNLYDTGINVDANTDIFESLNILDSVTTQNIFNLDTTDTLSLNDYRGLPQAKSETLNITDLVEPKGILFNTANDFYFLEDYALYANGNIHIGNLLSFTETLDFIRSKTFTDVLNLIDTYVTDQLAFDSVSNQLFLIDSLIFEIPFHYFITDTLTINHSLHLGNTYNISVASSVIFNQTESDYENPRHVSNADILSLVDTKTTYQNPQHVTTTGSIIFTDVGRSNLYNSTIADILSVNDNFRINLFKVTLTDILSTLDFVGLQDNHQFLDDLVQINHITLGEYSIFNFTGNDKVKFNEVVIIGVGIYQTELTDTLIFIDYGINTHFEDLDETLTITDDVQRITYMDTADSINCSQAFDFEVVNTIVHNLTIVQTTCLGYKGKINITDTLVINSNIAKLTAPIAITGPNKTTIYGTIKKKLYDHVSLNDKIYQVDPEDDHANCVTS